MLQKAQSMRPPTVGAIASKWAHAIWPLFFATCLFAIALPPLDFSLASVPYGDHGSNSMLVLKAKSFELLHGNYSRVGFYHPGPYYLYVMAAGEWLLCDLLQISDNPTDAHRIAISISNLILFTIIYRLLIWRTGGPLIAAIATILIVAITQTHAPVLHSLWPPHMYIAPAALMTVALWLLIRGHGGALWAYALGAGILVHGHASNLGLMPIAFALIVAGAVGSRLLLGQSLDLKSFQRWISPHLIPALVVFAILLAPFAMQTILFWPGETPKYLAQAGGIDNAAVDALNYTFSYWRHWTWAAAAALLVLVLRLSYITGGDGPKVAGSMLRDDLTAALVVFFALSGAMTFYAIKGVDNLEHRYIGLWYAGAVSSLVGITTCVGLLFLSRHQRTLGVGVVSALAVLCMIAFSSSPWRSNNDGPHVATILSLIKSHTEGQTAIITGDRSSTWRRTVGVLDQNSRQDVVDICIPRRIWRVLFHNDYLCNEETTHQAIIDGDIFHVSTQELAANRFQKLATLHDLHIYKFVDIAAEMVEFDIPKRRDDAEFIHALTIGDGWGRLERDRIWQVDRDAYINVLLKAFPGDRTIEIELGAFIPDASITQSVIVQSDFASPQEFEFTKRRQLTTFKLLAPASSIDQIIRVRISVDELRSPQEWGLKSDDRRLGVNLRKIAVRTNDADENDR